MPDTLCHRRHARGPVIHGVTVLRLCVIGPAPMPAAWADSEPTFGTGNAGSRQNNGASFR